MPKLNLRSLQNASLTSAQKAVLWKLGGVPETETKAILSERMIYVDCYTPKLGLLWQILSLGTVLVNIDLRDMDVPEFYLKGWHLSIHYLESLVANINP